MTMSEDGFKLIHQSILPSYQKRVGKYIKNMSDKLQLEMVENSNTKKSRLCVVDKDNKQKEVDLFAMGTVTFHTSDYYGNFFQQEKHGRLPEIQKKCYKTQLKQVDRSITLGTKVGDISIVDYDVFLKKVRELEKEFFAKVLDPDQSFDLDIVNKIDEVIFNDSEYTDKPKALKDIKIREKVLFEVIKTKKSSPIGVNKIKNPEFDSVIQKNKYHPEFKKKGVEKIVDSSQQLLKFISYKSFPLRNKDNIQHKYLGNLQDPENLFSEQEKSDHVETSWRMIDTDNKLLDIKNDNFKRGDVVVINFSIQPYISKDYAGLRFRATGVRKILQAEISSGSFNNDDLFCQNDIDENLLADMETLKNISQHNSNKRKDIVLDEQKTDSVDKKVKLNA